ncbi:Lrp/AsnC family transcriptional regulator [Rhodophyticola porphyridii]|uniref:Lrp/AsnC family transcriptional regulator n=1 Tax=Rhodophyticola porphyridii TaxID=1852017 RepID=A0A3L9Y325_9RHOB|nr:Lrp/AsnC family transcriptional regulator [Rhodophyticola porphyridii]RMA41875.1 Lrp/AsnC family transcriptional regulator [Rhodophyticola porphyridii]
MLDQTDRRLLKALQQNATLTAQELGEVLNLSASQAGRRRQRLEAAGFITGARAIIDADRVGLGVQAFVQVQMAAHSRDNDDSFARLVRAQDAITAAFTLTGEADYLLRIWCADLQALHQIIHGILLPHPSVARVQSQIVMDQMKPDAPLPL